MNRPRTPSADSSRTPPRTPSADPLRGSPPRAHSVDPSADPSVDPSAVGSADPSADGALHPPGLPASFSVPRIPPRHSDCQGDEMDIVQVDDSMVPELDHPQVVDPNTGATFCCPHPHILPPPPNGSHLLPPSSLNLAADSERRTYRCPLTSDR